MEVVFYPDRAVTSPQSRGKSFFYLDKQVNKDMNNNMNHFWLKPIIKSPLKASIPNVQYYLAQLNSAQLTPITLN